MNAITGLNMEEFYHAVHVPIGEPIRILGASFEFDYGFQYVFSLIFSRNPLFMDS